MTAKIRRLFPWIYTEISENCNDFIFFALDTFRSLHWRGVKYRRRDTRLSFMLESHQQHSVRRDGEARRAVFLPPEVTAGGDL